MDKTTPVYKDCNLQLIFIITLFAVMGVASIAPAFPQIIRHFAVSEREVGWLVASFTLPGVFLTPVMGVLADRLGRKNILVPSLILFGIAGFSCIFADTFGQLLLIRFFQGIGAASLGSINVTLIGDLYSAPRRTEIMGYNASVLSIGTAAYPAVGGVLAMAGWQYPFVLPILAIPLGIMIVFRLKTPAAAPKQELGAYLRNTWRNINQRSVWGLFILNILAFFLIYGAYLTYLPLLMETSLRSTSLTIGLVMSLASVTMAIVSASIGKINRLFRPRMILIIGVGFYLASMVLYAFSDSYLFIMLPVLLYGFGQGMVLPTMQTLLLEFAPIEQRAAFMSINSMVLRIGQTTGPVVIGFAYALGGTQYAFLSGGVVAVIMLGIVLGMVRR
ncbi:MAG TPA: MFS transporter [Acidobacteriota bacterium]|nr:MFS transporter [Acidobacteriota bacterium]